jgi:hypothetical protein
MEVATDPIIIGSGEHSYCPYDEASKTTAQNIPPNQSNSEKSLLQKKSADLTSLSITEIKCNSEASVMAPDNIRFRNESNTSLSSISDKSQLRKPLKIDKFLKGFKRFRNTYFAENSLYQELKIGQKPKTLLIGCCDSRVDPAILTDCAPGDIFVVRNVANLVPPYVSDGGKHGVPCALEYGVSVLEVENIIILGHSRCGGIECLMRGTSDNFEFIGPWMKSALEAKLWTLKYGII